MTSNHTQEVTRIAEAFASPSRNFCITNAVRIDARGVVEHSWITVVDGIIAATGTSEEECAAACQAVGIAPDSDDCIDARHRVLTPGYIDIHAHGAWEHSFDDGPEAMAIARAGHLVHGTTRQVLSLITNPLAVMQQNVGNVHTFMKGRPDVLGAHLEGPFISPKHKGAHDPNSLCEPTPEAVEALLESSQGCIRQITIAPELEHGLEAIATFAQAGTIPAVGHTDADYAMTLRGFDAGAELLTHIFNAMNGIHHRAPGPIPAALEDSRVSVELINDGFHVQNPAVKLAFELFPHRICFITDAMEATGCADGNYKLGSLDVTVTDGHVRLVSNGAIAGSTLTMDAAVRRGILELGLSPQTAVEAATLAPAKAMHLNQPNPTSQAPLGLLAPGYAADLLLQNRDSWTIEAIWCSGKQVL